MAARPKRQHFVPRAYLERFAAGGTVLVRRRDGGVFEANPRNVAVEAGMYDLPAPGGGRSTAVEVGLASIDGAAVLAFREVDATERPPAVGSETRSALSVFLALQMTRTPEQRERAAFPERVAEYAGGREVTRELVAEFLEKVHLRFRPSDREVEGALTFATVALQDRQAISHAATLALMFAAVREAVPLINAMNWSLEADRKERLITSDSPVVVWRKPSLRDKFMGVGIMNADELRFPLDPGKQLVLSRKSRATSARISGDRARSCNADVALASHQFIVGRPDRRSALQALPLPKHRPVLRFNVAPGVEVGPDGREEPMGDIYHAWVPRR